MTEKLTSELATETGVISEVIEVPTEDGVVEREVDYREASLEEAAELEAREEGGEDEMALMREAVDEYVATPSDLNVKELGLPTLEALMRGMYRAWGLAEDDIDEMLDDRSGN